VGLGLRVGRGFARWDSLARAGRHTHLRLTIVAVDVLQVRDNALRVARVARVDPVHRSLRRPGKRVEVQPLVAHLPKANERTLKPPRRAPGVSVGGG
jgi:hypothetical protein